MTLDEAIKHCLEVAEKNECKMTSDDGCTDVSMKRCAAEHRQLAEWLKELKEAKRLLEMALCELNNGTCTKFCSTCTRVSTEECLDYKKKNYRWIHTAEALKLIGEDEHENT